MTDYGWINQPKLSIVFNLNSLNSIYANWGKTFQLLTGGAIASGSPYGSTNKSVSINTGKEIGFKFNNNFGLDGRVAVWQQDAPDEIANLAAAGNYIALGSTRRRGIDFQAVSKISRATKLWLSHSIQEAKIVAGYISELTGTHIFGTPNYMSTIGIEHALDEKIILGMQARAQGGYYINTYNTNGKFGDYLLFDSSAKYQASKSVIVDFQVRNLFNRAYASDVWDGNAISTSSTTSTPYFSAGAPRSFFLTAIVKF
jgi:iron complex outermembrane receptor protein